MWPSSFRNWPSRTNRIAICTSSLSPFAQSCRAMPHNVWQRHLQFLVGRQARPWNRRLQPGHPQLSEAHTVAASFGAAAAARRSRAQSIGGHIQHCHRCVCPRHTVEDSHLILTPPAESAIGKRDHLLNGTELAGCGQLVGTCHILLASMEGFGVRRNSITYNAAISACANSGLNLL